MPRSGPLVKFEVARIDNRPGWSANSQRQTVWNAVIDVDRVNGKSPELDGLAWHRFMCGQRTGHQTVLLHFAHRDSQSESSTPDGRHVLSQFFEQIRQTADMVFVPMREDDADHAVPVLDEESRIRDYEVHAQHVVIREHQATVNDQQLAVVLEYPAVLSNLTYATQGDDGETILLPLFALLTRCFNHRTIL